MPELFNAATSPRTLNLAKRQKILIRVGESVPVTEEQLEECKKNKVVGFWIAEGDLVVGGGEDEEPAEFPGKALEKAWALLLGAGYESAEDVVAATVGDLMEVNGIGEATAEKIMAAAAESLAAEE